jgi:DNA-directed RNA polymerase subunit RPC12/RpoP
MYVGCIKCKKGFKPFDYTVDTKTAMVTCPFCGAHLQLPRKPVADEVNFRKAHHASND